MDSMDKPDWDTFCRAQVIAPTIGLRIDLSRLSLDPDWLVSMAARVDRACAEMAAIERGDVINTAHVTAQGAGGCPLTMCVAALTAMITFRYCNDHSPLQSDPKFTERIT